MEPYLAESHLAVLPCREKVALTKNGYRDATIDPGQIDEWATEYPGCSWGILPARCDPPLLVLDVDVKNEAVGEQELAKLEAEGLAPATYTVRTPSGGRHLYYILPPGTPPIGNRPVAPSVDIRHAIGYVIWYPPQPGMIAPQPAPPELIARCTKAQERADDAGEWLIDPDLPDNIERYTDWLRREVEAGNVAVAGQGANNLTYATAEVARDFALSIEMCTEVLWQEWNPFCVPPKISGHHLEQLQAIVENAYRYALRPAGNRVDHSDAIAELVKVADVPTNGTPAPAGLEFLTVDQLAALPRPAPLIKGVLYERHLMMMLGAWGSYKSFVALDQAAHLALGRDWAGRKIHEPRDVLYIAAEGAGGIAGRLEAWRLKHKGSPARLRVLAAAPQFADGGAAALNTALRGHAEGPAPFRPSVIYLDTLASSTAGLDESSSTDMGAVIQALRLLIQEHDTTIVMVHHTGKDAKAGARGWSGLEAACDSVLMVAGDEDNMTVVVETRKSKDGARGAPIWLQGEEQAIGIDDDGDLVTSLAFSPVAAPGPSVERLGKKLINEVRTATFLKLVPAADQDAMLTPALAHTLVMTLKPDEAEDSQPFKDEYTRMRRWLSQVARRGEGDPRVLACRVEGVGPGGATAWRAPVEGN